ncbi:MAG: hypothetical protein AAFO29_25020, partial [Actinomycetota bacterium]
RAAIAALVLGATACSGGTESEAGPEPVIASTSTGAVTSTPEADDTTDDTEAEEDNPSMTVQTTAPEADAAAGGERPLQAWRQSMEDLRGPVDSLAQPFEAAFSYFPDGIDTQPPGTLTFDSAALTVGEDPNGPFSRPGLDSLRIQATFFSDATFDQIVDWVQSSYPAGGTWEINASEDRSDDQEQVQVFQILQPGVDPGSRQYTIAVIDDGEASIQFDYSERDVQTTAPFEDLAGITDDLPRPIESYPTGYQVDVDDGTVFYKATWALPDVQAEDVARDLVVQLPANGIELVTLPDFDGSTDYSMEVACEDTLWCTLRASELQGTSDQVVSVIWSLDFPHLGAGG